MTICSVCRFVVTRAGILLLLFCLMCEIGAAQGTPVERTFREPKTTVEKTLKQLQSSLSGHLPTLEGFAQTGDHPLNHYQRAFYQCSVQLNADPTGGTVVRVSAKVTAWYADAIASRSGYQLLKSNGRIETDVLDQLSESLLSGSVDAQQQKPITDRSAAATISTSQETASQEPTISAPAPAPGTGSLFSSPAGSALSDPELPSQRHEDEKSSSKASELRNETASLEQVLKNQAHPRNLVAVKKSGTPVVDSPSLNAKTLFLASAEDEFEMLDFNSDWVHVRISGLSRGWIWRTSLEMPEGIPDVPRAVATSPATAADLFQVSREETSQFPGDWEPLRGKNVKIVSVQKIKENEAGSGASAKLEFAKALFDKGYDELAKSADLSGIVLIFDSIDGGMIAIARPTIQRWKAGALNDAAMWHQCYFDPPETFTVSSAAGSR